jgi:hypothetical protein
LVERNLAKVDVASSSLVSRSFSFIYGVVPKWLRESTVADKTVFNKIFGVVPKWLREQSAKLLCIGSNPIDTSKVQTNLKLLRKSNFFLSVNPYYYYINIGLSVFRRSINNFPQTA